MNVAKAIADCAFKTTELPVILSLEVRLGRNAPCRGLFAFGLTCLRVFATRCVVADALLARAAGERRPGLAFVLSCIPSSVPGLAFVLSTNLRTC